MSDTYNHLYLDGEEKFGPFTSRLYAGFAGIATRKVYRQIVAEVNKARPTNILDIGCGPGNILMRLAEVLPDSKFMGIDPSPSMVEIARKRVIRRGLSGRVTVRMGSSRNLDIDSMFDLIISSFSFHHWKKQMESVRNITSRLSDGGSFSIFELNADGFYGRLPGVKKHALSAKQADAFSLNGFSKTVRYSDDSRLIILSFLKDRGEGSGIISDEYR